VIFLASLTAFVADVNIRLHPRRLFTLLRRRIMMYASHGMWIMGKLPAISAQLNAWRTVGVMGS